MRQEQTVHARSFALRSHLDSVIIIIQKTFLVDIVDIHELYAQLLQAISRQICVLDRVWRTENTAPGWRKTQYYFCHTILPFSLYHIPILTHSDLLCNP